MEKYDEVELILHAYFKDLKDQAETHAIRIVCKAAGVELR